MLTHGDLRIEPSAEVLDAARRWLEGPRGALGAEFLSAYVTGSALMQGFDAAHSRVNLLVVSRALPPEILGPLADAIPETKKPPHFEPLFLTRRQIEKSVDVFPIEWLEVKERHLRLEGEDVLTGIDVPLTYLRLQCEHELRGKHIQLRQAFLARLGRKDGLEAVLKSSASSFATLFRTLLRLRGETPPADQGRVIERVADLFGLDAQGLLGAHLLRYPHRAYKPAEVVALYRAFLAQIDTLVEAIDQLTL